MEAAKHMLRSMGRIMSTVSFALVWAERYLIRPRAGDGGGLTARRLVRGQNW
jgi:hypothetical protein